MIYFLKLIHSYSGVTPIKIEVKDAKINNRQEPTYSILGIDNCSKIEDNGFWVNKSMKVKVSMRLPPGINENELIDALKSALKNNIYFGVKFNIGNIDL